MAIYAFSRRLSTPQLCNIHSFLAALSFAINCPGIARAADLSANWSAATTGNWNDPTNWDSTDFPNNGGGDNYDVTIDVDGAPYTVTLNTAIAIDNFTLDSADAAVNHTSGNFSVVGTADLAAGAFRLNGGTIMGGSWEQTGGTLQFANNGNNRLDDLAVAGGLELGEMLSQVRLLNGANFLGTANLTGAGSQLFVESDLVFENVVVNVSGGNSGAIANAIRVSGMNTLTLDSNTQLNLSSSFAGLGQDFSNLGSTAINQGIITVKGSAVANHRSITVDVFNNQNTVHVTDGNALRLFGNDSWSNSGTYLVDNGSTLRVLDSFTTAGLGFVDNSAGGTVSLEGTLDNSGEMLTLDAATVLVHRELEFELFCVSELKGDFLSNSHCFLQ